MFLSKNHWAILYQLYENPGLEAKLFNRNSLRGLHQRGMIDEVSTGVFLTELGIRMVSTRGVGKNPNHNRVLIKFEYGGWFSPTWFMYRVFSKRSWEKLKDKMLKIDQSLYFKGLSGKYSEVELSMAELFECIEEDEDHDRIEAFLQFNKGNNVFANVDPIGMWLNNWRWGEYEEENE